MNRDTRLRITPRKETNHKPEALQMKPQTKRRILIFQIISFVVCAFFASTAPVDAQAMTHPDSNPQTNWDIRKTYFLRFPAAAQHGPAVEDNPEGHDEIEEQRSLGPGTITHGPGPVQSWPVQIPTAVSEVPTLRDTAIMENLFDTFGYPVSDTQFQIIERYNHNRFLEQLFDPEKLMWLSTSIGSIQANAAGNSLANMSVNQNVTAIEYNMRPIYNFTIDDGNIWNRLRNELFVPMAVLLLLPGAVLAQVRAIVAQGSPAIVGEVNPFEGIIRSIVAIFLIPGSYLVVNYGIDVSNSIKHTIATEFTRITGEDMYELSKCAIKRAYPINDPRSNRNAIEHSEEPHIELHDVWSPYESLTLNLRMYDPCLNVDESRVPDEDVRQAKPVNRALVNGFGALNGISWNVACAFQVVFLYYLWCLGPVAAALSVWPIGQMRDAFKSWCEGVITVCFWTLFWSTIILLMAAFKGVGDSGTIYVTALEMMAMAAVKSAFDFAGLASSVGATAMGEATKAAGGEGRFAQQGQGLRSGGRSAGGGGGAVVPNQGGQGSPGSGGAVNPGGTGPTDGSRVEATGTPVAAAPVAVGGGSSGGTIPAGGLASQMGQGGTGNMGVGGGTDSASRALEGPMSGGADAAAGAQPDPGLPPNEQTGAGKSGDGTGAGDALGAAAGMAIAGAAAGGKDKQGTGAGGGDASLSLSQNATINKFGRQGEGGPLSNLVDAATGRDKDGMGLPPLMGGAILDSGVHNKIAAADQAINNAINSGEGIRGVIQAAGNVMDPMNPLGGALSQIGMAAMPQDAGPLTDMINNATGSPLNREAMANGIDPDFADNPQATLARNATQDLMNIDADPNQEGVQPLVSQDMLRDALNGDQAAIESIDKNLGVSPEVLNNALHGDSGSASLLLAAAGHRANHDPGSALHQAAAGGNMAAVEAFKASAGTNEDLIFRASHGDALSASHALQANGADTQAWMASSSMAGGELNQAGIPLEHFRQAQNGDVAMQQEISRQMGLGDNNFEMVNNAVRGDTQDAATMLAARGAHEMQNMNPEQIQQAIQQGDASIIAGSSTDPGVLARAMGDDQGARQQIQDNIAANPHMMVAANGTSSEAMRAVHATNGERPDVLASNASNTYDMMSMVANPEQVQAMMSAPHEQRMEFMNGVSDQLNLDRAILPHAAGGNSVAAATFMAAAGGHQRVQELAQSGGHSLAQAAVVAHNGVNPDSLQAAASGSYAAGFNVQNSIQDNGQLQQLYQAGNESAGAMLYGTQDVTAGYGNHLNNAELNPQGMVYAASNGVQAQLNSLGVDPVAVARGDQAAFSQMHQALNIDPSSAQAQSINSVVSRGLSGDGAAATTFGAYLGRSENVQAMAQTGDMAAQAAVVASHAVPHGVIDSAIQGDLGSQAYLQHEVAYNPHMMSLAHEENAQAMNYVQSSQGADAVASINASANTQRMMGYYADQQVVQNALYSQGPQKAAAISNISRGLGVAPVVLSRALSGQAGPAATGFFKASQTTAMRNAARDGDPFARAIVSTQGGQNTAVTDMAASGNHDAAVAVNRTIAENQALQEAAQHNQEAASVWSVASTTADPGNYASAQDALSRNVTTPQMDVQPQASYMSYADPVSYSSPSYTGSSSSYAQSSEAMSRSSTSFSGSTSSPFVTYGSDGRQIVIDPNNGTVIPATSSHAHMAGYRHDAGDPGAQYQKASYQQAQAQASQTSYNDIQPQDGASNYTAADTQGGAPDYNRQIPDSHARSSVDDGGGGMSSSAYERLSQATPPQSSGAQGGLSSGPVESSQPVSDLAYGQGSQPVEGQDLRAQEIRSEQDPGTLARDATSQEQIAYNSPQTGSLNDALRGAVPPAGANQAERAQRAQEKAEMERQNAQLQQQQQQEEAKRRKMEADRLQEKKKADYDRYREKIQSEIDEIEAEAERYNEEEDGNL